MGRAAARPSSPNPDQGRPFGHTVLGASDQGRPLGSSAGGAPDQSRKSGNTLAGPPLGSPFGPVPATPPPSYRQKKEGDAARATAAAETGPNQHESTSPLSPPGMPRLE